MQNCKKKSLNCEIHIFIFLYCGGNTVWYHRMDVNGNQNCLVTSILQNSFFIVPQKKQSHITLERHEWVWVSNRQQCLKNKLGGQSHWAPSIACSLLLLVTRWHPSYIETVKTHHPLQILPHLTPRLWWKWHPKEDLWALLKLHDMLIFWYAFNMPPLLLLNPLLQHIIIFPHLIKKQIIFTGLSLDMSVPACLKLGCRVFKSVSSDRQVWTCLWQVWGWDIQSVRTVSYLCVILWLNWAHDVLDTSYESCYC